MTQIETRYIETDNIKFSPYQCRKYFDESKIAELAADIEKNELIHPVCVRAKGEGFELLAGERRLRATRFNNSVFIRAEIRDVDDTKAREIVLSENIQREDLTPLEQIASFASWVDFRLSQYEDYRDLHVSSQFQFKCPHLEPHLHTLAFLLMKLHSDIVNNTNNFINKFVNKVEKAFASLPVKKDWRSFYVHELKPYSMMTEGVKEVSVKQKLNKSQAKAVHKLQQEAPQEFLQLKATGIVSIMNEHYVQEPVSIAEVSSREIEKKISDMKREKRHMKLEQAKKENLDLLKRSLTENLPEIYEMDCLEFLETIEEKSVDLLCTDPPYSTDVKDIAAFAKLWTLNALRKVKDTGRAFICIGAYPLEVKAYLDVLLSTEFIVDAPLIWTYRNTLGVTPKMKYNLNYQMILHVYTKKSRPLDTSITNEMFSVQDINAPDGRRGDRFHTWQKPDELGLRLVKHTTEEGEKVLDCFAGTGTFLLMASKLKRVGIGCEKNTETLMIAEERGAHVIYT